MTDTYRINSQHNWVASYPKSGNTWIRYLLKSYSPELIQYSDSSLLAFQTVASLPLESLTIWQQMQLRGAALFFLSCMANNSETLIKSHHMFGKWRIDENDDIGIPLFTPVWVGRAIYVVRDPRDVACSLANHMGYSHTRAVEFMAEHNATLSDGLQATHIITSWSEHVQSWTGQQAAPTLLVRYEDLQEDPESELRDIVEFMGWEVDEQKISQAVEDNRFEKWQQREQTEGFSEARQHGPFFRRGIAGGWRDELAPELVKQIEEQHTSQMIAMGYELEETANSWTPALIAQ
jgi:hypothetical protein